MKKKQAETLKLEETCTNEVLTTAQIYEADRLALTHVGRSYKLMQNAASAVTRLICQKVDQDTRILLLCGRGNNGGDGFLAATLLARQGFDVELLFCGGENELAKVQGDARIALEESSQANLKLHLLAAYTVDSLQAYLSELASGSCALLIVDAIFGVGLSRPIEGNIRFLIETINKLADSHQNYLSGTNGMDTPAIGNIGILSIDIPSGINGDTGQILGVAICADSTISFFRKKPAHLLFPGRTLCGRLEIADIGIPTDVLNTISPNIKENTVNLWLDVFPPNSITAHKYTRGHVIVASGPKYMTGAARLAATAALRAGAGLVSLASPPDSMSINAAHCTEVMQLCLENADALQELLADKRLNSLVVGPGFGVGAGCREMVLESLEHCRNVVLDADALTSFTEPYGSEPEELFSAIRQSSAVTVLTPHEGEFNRLFDVNTNSSTNDKDLQGKAERTARASAVSSAIVIFKGPDTIIASPQDEIIINTNALPWLATAGSGDVLAGTIAGLLAQTDDADVPVATIAQRKSGQSDSNRLLSVAAAVWLYGEASRLIGPGLIASDIATVYPEILRSLHQRSIDKRRKERPELANQLSN